MTGFRTAVPRDFPFFRIVLVSSAPQDHAHVRVGGEVDGFDEQHQVARIHLTRRRKRVGESASSAEGEPRMLGRCDGHATRGELPGVSRLEQERLRTAQKRSPRSQKKSPGDLGDEDDDTSERNDK
jgi:hypothetical protein